MRTALWVEGQHADFDAGLMCCPGEGKLAKHVVCAKPCCALASTLGTCLKAAAWQTFCTGSRSINPL